MPVSVTDAILGTRVATVNETGKDTEFLDLTLQSKESFAKE